MAGAEALGGVFVKEMEDEILELRAALDVRRDLHSEVFDVGEDLVGAVAVKRCCAKYELEQKNAVGPPIDGCGLVADTTDNFRSNVFRGSDKGIAGKSWLEVVAFGRRFIRESVKEHVESRALDFRGAQKNRAVGHLLKLLQKYSGGRRGARTKLLPLASFKDPFLARSKSASLISPLP